MKKIFLILSIIMSISSLFAQTKKIAHRSHSGSNKTFTAKVDGNFGWVVPSLEERKRIDSQRKVQLQKDSIKKAKQVDSLKKATPKPKMVIAKTKK